MKKILLITALLSFSLQINCALDSKQKRFEEAMAQLQAIKELGNKIDEQRKFINSLEKEFSELFDEYLKEKKDELIISGLNSELIEKEMLRTKKEKEIEIKNFIENYCEVSKKELKKINLVSLYKEYFEKNDTDVFLKFVALRLVIEKVTLIIALGQWEARVELLTNEFENF